MKKILICLMMLLLVVGCSSSNQKNKKEETVKKEEKTEEKEPVNTSIKLNFAGDCTLGNYAGQAYDGSFNQEYAKQGNDATYFFKNVKNVFENDDLTIVNLEGPLTSATSHVEKQFPFSGPKEYVNILTSGSVELVSIANNHSEDYYEQGMTDTKQVLDERELAILAMKRHVSRKLKELKLAFWGIVQCLYQ